MVRVRDIKSYIKKSQIVHRTSNITDHRGALLCKFPLSYKLKDNGKQ